MSQSSALRRATDRPPSREGTWPGYLLGALFAGVAGWQAAHGGPIPWALSLPALAEGRYETLLTHMVSHAGLPHLLFNTLALLSLSPPVVRAMSRGRGRGRGRAGGAMIVRYLAFFILGGLAAAGLFVALNLDQTLPMLGASGAICAIWGLLARIDPEGGPDKALWSPHALRVMRDFTLSNALLVLLINGLASAAGAAGGIAWEAHVGGFLFGLLLGPLFVPPVPPPPPMGPWGPRV
ncbi:MAG: rhomboid family intramembrane serine protease [Caulobacteraceae bacterium]|nr:rhomboid family intramembrane serine protease [Caulobacteraceae bacterium]